MQLDGLYIFCKDYHMIVNKTKNKIMVFGKDTDFKFMYNNKVLEKASKYKYLSIMFKPISCNKYYAILLGKLPQI